MISNDQSEEQLLSPTLPLLVVHEAQVGESRLPVVEIVDCPPSGLNEEEVGDDDDRVHTSEDLITIRESPEGIVSNIESTAYSADDFSHRLENTEGIRSIGLGDAEQQQLEQDQSPQPNNETLGVTLIHQPETNNPFDVDIMPNKSSTLDQIGQNLTPKKGASKTNPFAYDSDSDQLVAAICAGLDDEERKQEDREGDGDDMSDEGNGHTWRTSLPMRCNPFDVDGETADADDDIETLTRQQQQQQQQQQQTNESLAPFTLSNKTQFRHHVTTPSSSSSKKTLRTFSIKYAQQIQDLQQWGFDYSLCTHALMHTHGNVDKAKQLMVAHILDDRRLVSNVQSWTSPVMVRVGGWLPNVQGDIGTDIHTAYFISVTMTSGNESWRVGHRYSEFWAFYCAVYPRICEAMPQGMKNVFPADRLSSWFGHTLGVEMEGFNDNRMRLLDGWLKELCINSSIMLDEDTRTKVYDFLQVNGNLERLHRFRQGQGTSSGVHSNNSNNNNNNSNNNNVSSGSSSSSSSSRPTSFRSRSSTDTIPRTATPSTPSWPNSSLCCTFSVPMQTHHEGVNVPGGTTGTVGGLVSTGTPSPGIPVVENQHHHVVDMNSPEMALINRRKAAIASQQNDDSASRGHDHDRVVPLVMRTNKGTTI